MWPQPSCADAVLGQVDCTSTSRAGDLSALSVIDMAASVADVMAIFLYIGVFLVFVAAVRLGRDVTT